MSRNLGLVSIAFGMLLAGLLPAAAHSAEQRLLCASRQNALVYYNTVSQILLEATVAGDSELTDYSLSMPKSSQLGYSTEKAKADAQYKPRNPKYTGMNRFATGDAWCTYYLIAPKLLSQQQGKFETYLQQICEAGFISTETLYCKVAKTEHSPDKPGETPFSLDKKVKKAVVDSANAYLAKVEKGVIWSIRSPMAEIEFALIKQSSTEVAVGTELKIGHENDESDFISKCTSIFKQADSGWKISKTRCVVPLSSEE